jgi:rhodanese-related sulfurtransferase
VSSFVQHAPAHLHSSATAPSAAASRSCLRSAPLATSRAQATGTLAAAQAKFDEAPVGYSALGAAALLATVYAVYKTQYAGVAGRLSPQQLFAVLNEEDNAVVVDVRREDELEKNGVLDLTRRARGKGVSMPPIVVRPPTLATWRFTGCARMDSRCSFSQAQSTLRFCGHGQTAESVRLQVRKELRWRCANADDLQTRIHAALITNLMNVTVTTKIIILGDSGSYVRAVARAVCDLGFRGFEATGGFAAWRKAGLGVKAGSSYKTMPGTCSTFACSSDSLSLLCQPVFAGALDGWRPIWQSLHKLDGGKKL